MRLSNIPFLLSKGLADRGRPASLVPSPDYVGNSNFLEARRSAHEGYSKSLVEWNSPANLHNSVAPVSTIQDNLLQIGAGPRNGLGSPGCFRIRQLRTFCQIVLFGLALNGFLAIPVNADSNQTYKGDKCMTSTELVEALRQAHPTQRSAIDSLSRNVAEQALAPIRAVVTLLNDPDPKMSDKAARLISGIGDLAIVPLLESPEPRTVSDKLWNIETVLTAHLVVRERIVARLDSILADKTLITWGTVGPVEEKPQPSRVCDEAYLMMRRLLNPKEGTMESIHESKAFLALTDKEKDAEILKAKKSRAWSNLTGKEE